MTNSSSLLYPSAARQREALGGVRRRRGCKAKIGILHVRIRSGNRAALLGGNGRLDLPHESEALPHQVDVAAQVVDPIDERDRDANPPHRRVNALEVGAAGVDVGGSIRTIESALQRREMAVPVG